MVLSVIFSHKSTSAQPASKQSPCQQLHQWQPQTVAGVLIATGGLRSLVAALLYARAGLLPAVVFLGGLTVHLLWGVG